METASHIGRKANKTSSSILQMPLDAACVSFGGGRFVSGKFFCNL